MKITLITVGKIKEKYLRDAIAEYSKRLSRYCKLEIIEVADEKTPDHASDVVENTIRDKEAERIMKYVKEDAYVITLEINGNFSVPKNFLQRSISLESGTQSYYIYHWWIHWFGQRSARKIGLCIKLFKMTFPHQLMRVILLEADIQKLSDHQH